MPRAEAKYVIRAEDKTQRGLRSAESRLERFGSFIRANIGSAITAVGAGITAWGAAFAASTRDLAELEREAAALSSTLEEAASIRLAADLLGTDAGEIRDLYETVAERIDEAAEGSKDVADNFARFGIDPETLRGLSAIETVATLSNQFRNLPQQQALSASSALFGEGRGRILGQDVTGALARADQLGLLRNLPELVQNASEASKAFAEFSAVFRRRRDDVLSSAAVTEGLRFGTEALARPLDFSAVGGRAAEDTGSITLGQNLVRAQLSSTRSLERAARNLETATARYSR